MINKKFSYIKLAVCGLLALSFTNRTLALTDEQMGIEIGVGGNMSVRGILEQKSSNMTVFGYYGEQTTASASAPVPGPAPAAPATTGKADNSGTGVLTSNWSASTNAAKGVNKINTENSFGGYVTVGYVLTSPSGTEGGFKLLGGIYGKGSTGYKETIDIENGNKISLKGVDLNSGLVDLPSKDNVEYETIGDIANNKITTQYSPSYGGGVFVSANYRTEGGMTFGGNVKAGFTSVGAELTQSNQFRSSDKNTYIADILKVQTSGKSDNAFAFNGGVNVVVSFEITDTISVGVSGGASYTPATKVSFKDLSIKSESAPVIQKVHPTGAAAGALNPMANPTAANMRFYGAPASAGANHEPLAENAAVVHKGTAITEKKASVDIELPSSMTAEFGLQINICL